MAALSNSEKLTLVSNLGTMLSSGIPILEAVESLLQEKSKSTKVLLTLTEDLNQGKTLAYTFNKFPDSFNPVVVNLIKAAEEAGTLDTTLKDLSISIKKDIEFSEKVKAALAYPALVMLVFFGVLFVILTIVIPRISTVFARVKIDLPLSTKILISISNVVVSNLPQVLVGMVALTILLVVLYRLKKQILINFLFSLPFLSQLGREIDLTRFCRSMSLLLSSGIPITEAIELSSQVVNKFEMYQLMKNCQELVASGKRLSDGFKKGRGIVPPIMVRITEAGEKSGTLEKSMQELSEYFDSQVTNSLKIITTLLEPVMLVIIGLLVGGIMLAIIAPIYGLIGQLKSR